MKSCEVGLEREVDHQLDRIDAPLGRHLGDGRVRRHRAVEARASAS